VSSTVKLTFALLVLEVTPIAEVDAFRKVSGFNCVKVPS
jgi:hypothetical protein